MNKVPNHVAIILDGNGRWATNRGLIRSMGHKAGADTIIKMAEYIFKRGVKVFSVFAFSTENFKRSAEEVNFLMNLFIQLFRDKAEILHKENIKVVFSGRRSLLDKKVLKAMEDLEELTKNNEYIFNMCLSYGGQIEIVDAVKRIINEGVKAEDIDQFTFKKYLYQELPDIDLVIRTSGEMRISNFMLYQMAYAEFFFTKTLWPDYSEKDFEEAVDSFNNRERRFGGINNNK